MFEFLSRSRNSKSVCNQKQIKEIPWVSTLCEAAIWFQHFTSLFIGKQKSFVIKHWSARKITHWRCLIFALYSMTKPKPKRKTLSFVQTKSKLFSPPSLNCFCTTRPLVNKPSTCLVSIQLNKIKRKSLRKSCNKYIFLYFSFFSIFFHNTKKKISLLLLKWEKKKTKT